MAKTAFKSIDDYIAAQPNQNHAILARVRSIIAKALTGADEVISYQIPAYKRGGRTIIYFAGWKEHFSVYPATEFVVSALKKELAGYKLSKGTIRFPLNDPVPAKLIARIARLRDEEVEQASAKTAKPAAMKSPAKRAPKAR